MKKIISIFLLFILMLGNVGITYGTHFCMGSAMKSELMIGQEHMDCGMGTMDAPKHDDNEPHFSAPDCCDNQYVSIEVEDTFNKSNAVELANLYVAITATNILYTLELTFDSVQPLAVDTSPPLLKQDFTVLYQVFTI